MSNFIIDTPYHKRWWLGDGVHQYNSVIYGDQLRYSVINSRTNDTVLCGYITIKEGWEDLSQLSQELAAKRFRKPKYDRWQR